MYAFQFEKVTADFVVHFLKITMSLYLTFIKKFSFSEINEQKSSFISESYLL